MKLGRGDGFAKSTAGVSNPDEIALILGFVIVQFVGTMMSGLIDYSPQRH